MSVCSHCNGGEYMRKADCDSAHAPIMASLARIEAKLDEQHKHLYIGNGTPAMLTRLDRLEQSAANQRKALWTIMTGVLTAAGAWLWERVKS